MNARIRLESLATACPSCGCGDTRVLDRIPPSNVFAGRELEQVLNGGGLWRCERCNLYFRWPRLTKDEAAKLYSDGYAHAWHSDLQRREDWTTAAGWLQQDMSGECRILDIGCGTGQFLSEVLGGRFKKYGIEINAEAAAVARKRGICILGADIWDSKIVANEKEAFAAVVVFDVIEHVEDPLNFLRICNELLQPGGHIIVSSGNTDARSWRWSGSRYWYCTIPEHISFINEKWCQYAAARLNLRLGRIHFFSHARGDIVKRVRQFVLNSVSIVAPRVFRAFRRAGLGRKNVRFHPEMADHPPSWMTAKDHLLVAFRRPCENGLKEAARRAG